MNENPTPTASRCAAAVYKRDTYRVFRDGSGRKFKMHYTRARCSRTAVDDSDFCAQHHTTRGVEMFERKAAS